MNFAQRLTFEINLIRSAAGPDGSGAASSNRRLQQTQAQVDEVRNIAACISAADVVGAIVQSEISRFSAPGPPSPTALWVFCV